ncbi:MAG: hypothetical protein NVS1B4_00350 [Gemmatimonadaceae bacterium]
MGVFFTEVCRGYDFPRMPGEGVICRTVACAGLVLAAGVLAGGCNAPGHASTYVPPDSVLAREPLFFYPAGDHARRRGFVFIFGNDVSFWEAHQSLAYILSTNGYDAVGMDLKLWLDSLPTGVAARDSAVRAGIVPLVAASRHALDADSLPIILAGHSFGAEFALWMAREVPPPRLRGIVLMSPRGSGHLVVTADDRANKEAVGPGSFSTPGIVKGLPRRVRVALVRSQQDKFGIHDSAFIAAGGARLRRYIVPFAGHSMRDLTFAAIQVRRGVAFIMEGHGADESGSR